MILIDEPRWPAHGTVFGHLVSDESLAELHTFAHACGLPIRAFDHDHYDVPAERLADCVALGAEVASSKELVQRLVATGLRVRPNQRTPSRAAVMPELRAAWAKIMPGQPQMGEWLLRAWSQRHRFYHDVRHLAHCLQSLGELGAHERAVPLAIWFHDAVYNGRPGRDEGDSARMAESALDGLIPRSEVSEVARLVLLTAAHAAQSDDERGQLVCDSDLAVLALPEARYHTYVRDVRLEHPSVTPDGFRRGRGRVVANLLGRERIYASDKGAARWESAARDNLTAEPLNFG